MTNRLRMHAVTFGTLLTMLGLLGFSSCKDKSAEEYERDKLQKNLSRYDSVSGVYSGVVTSKLDGHVLGAMELTLRADTQVNPGNGGDTSGAHPVLVGNIRFLDRTVINLAAPDGFYDPNTGLYHADIKIDRSAGTTPNNGGTGGTGVTGNGGSSSGPSSTTTSETVTIGGALTPNALSGEVQALNYPESGGRFRLEKNSPSLDDLLHQARPGDRGDGDATQVTSYSGATTFQTTTKPVHIMILQALHGTAEDFLNLIDPVKSVQVSMNYSQTLHFIYQNAVYDVRQGYLTGQTGVLVNNQTQIITLDCHTGEHNTMNCTHITSGGGVTAKTKLKLDTVPTQDPPDTGADRQSTTRKYIGSGYLADHDFRKNIQLVVTYPARSRLEDLVELFFPQSEQILNVSINFSEFATATFTGVKWDTQTGLLDGSFVTSGPSGTYSAQVQCHNFFFTRTMGPFSCSYWTNRSPQIDVNFKPPYRP